ncbi:MAG: integrase [Alteromonas sp. TMED35]|nr:MAG: integrase [Alteromonas sp. TMED35]
MNAQNKHLKRHHDTWVYSRRVPSALAHLYNSSHITFSLKTSSVKVARLKRDKFNGHLANQMQGTISPEREEFKRHLTVAKEYAEGIKDRDSCLTYDDFFPREPIAHAAYREVAYKDTNHVYSYTAKEALQSLLGRKAKLSDDTKQKLKNALDRFLIFMGVNDVALTEVHKKTVVAYIEHLGNEYAHGTIAAHLSRLKSVWVHAFQLGEITLKQSPFEDHDLSLYKKGESQRKQLFSKEQLNKVLNECPESVRPLAKLALFTGARISELCKADVEVVEGVKCLVVQKGKTKSAERYIPLAEQVKDIELPLRLDDKSAGRTFSTFKIDKITSDSTRSFHSLRNHFITAGQRAENLTEFDVAYVAGHKTGTTMSFGHYARHDVKRLKATVDKVASQIEKEWF